MRALVQYADGDETTFELASDIPKPTPGPNQALIKVYAAALNPVDIWRGLGIFGPDKFPRIAGYDFAGIVVDVNYEDDVERRVEKGDRVFGDLMKDSVQPKNGVLGSVAEFCVCDVDILGVMKEGELAVGGKVGMNEAAGMPVVAITVLQCFDRVKLKKGEKVLITAGSGGVGLHGMMIAKELYGAGKVACTASEESFGLCRDAGADVCVDYKKEDFSKVLEGWPDVLLDCTGEFERCKATMNERGRLISIVKESFAREDIESWALAPTLKEISTSTELLSSGKLRPVIDKIYSFDKAKEAIRHQASGRAKGKIVIEIAKE